MRNTQNLSIIRSEPPPAIGDETTWSLSGAAVGFISWLLALGIPFLLYGSNTLFFLLYTWPFFLALIRWRWWSVLRCTLCSMANCSIASARPS